MNAPSPISPSRKTGYAPINGLRMYYEITGDGPPLIYIPAAFAFSGITEFPELTKTWRVIQVDLQGHGRTADIDRPLSFDQHAKDIVTLMDHLSIERANFFGWSYGGLISTLIALRHPERAGRIATFGSLFGTPQQGIRPEMIGAMAGDSPDGPAHAYARAQYDRVAPDPAHWPVFWKKLIDLAPEGFSEQQLKSLNNRVLIALGDNDFIRLEHAIEAYRTIPKAELAVIPDATHFLLYDRPWKLEPIIAEFFAAPDERLPHGTIATGYQPGKTR
jgi:pimeloyl-ACP methyl ester carboxylesterase